MEESSNRLEYNMKMKKKKKTNGRSDRKSNIVGTEKDIMDWKSLDRKGLQEHQVKQRNWPTTE